MMVDLDTNPFPCGITDAELDPPDIYGDGDMFLTLPEGDGQDPDDDFDIDDMPLGDEEEPEAEAPAEEPAREQAETPTEEAQAVQDTAPAEETPAEPAQEPEAEAPAEEPAREPIAPWLEKAQARVRAIGRVRADVEDTARAEIEEVARALEGGGGDEMFAEYAKRLKAGDFADMNAAKRALNFYFSMRFATLTGLYDWAWMYDGGIETYLWTCYGDYIPADCWRRYADTLRQDPDREPDPRALFHMMWHTYAKIRAADIAARERDWERAAKAAGEARADVHGKCADRRTEEDFTRAHALQDAESQALKRTAYWWQYSLRSAARDAGKKTAAEYEKTYEEFKKRLGEYL